MRNGGFWFKVKVLSFKYVFATGTVAHILYPPLPMHKRCGQAGGHIQNLMTDEQINELADNLDCGLRCFVHREKKTIVATPDHDSDSELWDEVNDEIENNFDRYVEIEKMDSHESFRLMEHFIDTVDNSQLRDKLEEALRRPKPFANFKFDIDNSGPYRQKWFDFKKQRTIEWVRGQVIGNDL